MYIKSRNYERKQSYICISFWERNHIDICTYVNICIYTFSFCDLFNYLKTGLMSYILSSKINCHLKS